MYTRENLEIQPEVTNRMEQQVSYPTTKHLGNVLIINFSFDINFYGEFLQGYC